MDAYLELLKESYYKERNKLEEMSIYHQNGKLRFLVLQKEILDKAKNNLSVLEISGRSDLTEDVKENLLRNRDKAEKIEEYLKKAMERELADIEYDEERALKDAQYSCDDYAAYLLQLEKVNALEGELENNRILPEMVYEEQKLIMDSKNKTGGGQ